MTTNVFPANGRLNSWLDVNMGRFGFFRPYGSDRGGAGIEPWHLSYAPVARDAVEALRAAGATWFDLLTAYDELDDGFAVLLRVVRPSRAGESANDRDDAGLID